LGATDIVLPGGLRCNQWNERDFEANVRQFPGDDTAKKYDIAVNKIFTNVLSDPDEGQQGMKWNKPNHYIAVALASDIRIATLQQLDDAIGRLETGM
jgi:hypothetical protein